MTVKRSIQDPSAAALGKKPDAQNETSIPFASTGGRKPRRKVRGPKPLALADSAISGVIDANDPTKKPSTEQTDTPTSNAENSALSLQASNRDTARFHQHVRDCPECEQGRGRDGRLCLMGTLLAHPKDLRFRAKAPRLPTAVTGDSGEQFLMVRELADVLGLGPRGVRDYVARGELSGQFIRGQWRFGRKDIEDFLAMPPKWEIR